MTPEELALRFVTMIQICTTADEYAGILRRNKTVPAGCCATHDIMDANMMMLEAFQALTGREMHMNESVEADADRLLWNAAWAIATEQYLTEKP